MALRRLRGKSRISVNNEKCELFGICEWEAPQLFELGRDGRLRYRRQLAAEDWDQAVAAARCCPMQAIEVRGGNDE